MSFTGIPKPVAIARANARTVGPGANRAAGLPFGSTPVRVGYPRPGMTTVGPGANRAAGLPFGSTPIRTGYPRVNPGGRMQRPGQINPAILQLVARMGQMRR